MAELGYRDNSALVERRRPNWSAIWAGVFAFVAIWSVFGMLGEAVFASAAAPKSGNAVGNGIGWGMGIWSIILTMIAMYVAGRVTAHFADSATRSDAMLAAQTMFGLSVVAVLAVVAVGGNTLTGGSGIRGTESQAVSVLAGLGWAGFISLFLGWLCAMWGAASQVRPKAATQIPGQAPGNIRDIRAA